MEDDIKVVSRIPREVDFEEAVKPRIWNNGIAE